MTWYLPAYIVSYWRQYFLEISYRSRKFASQLLNIVSYLIIWSWKYQLSYCLPKALSAITGLNKVKFHCQDLLMSIHFLEKGMYTGQSKCKEDTFYSISNSVKYIFKDRHQNQINIRHSKSNVYTHLFPTF
jgi:hypothetical protein